MLLVLMAIRIIIVFLPFVVLLFLLIKKKIKALSVIIVALLFCNSILMLFSNMNQKNVIDMNSLNMSKIAEFFDDIDNNQSKSSTADIYVNYEKYEGVYRQIGTIDNITYKKYSVSNSIDDTLEKIVSESTILKNTPKLEQNNFQVSYYASDLKRKRVDLWNLLYNVPMYYGCIIIENAREIYYIEYEIELWSARTPIGLILEQMFYSVESNDKIDVMLFFSEECMAMPD